MEDIKKIMVTGGAGYVGYTLVEELSKRYPQSRIIVYDNFSKGRLETSGQLLKRFENIEILPWEKADIRDYHNFEGAIKKYNPEIVIHLAAIVDAFTTNREGKDRECEIVNYEAAIETAKICKREGVKQFIFQSSISIYSRGEGLHEESPKEPLSTYGRTKLRVEEEIKELDDGNFHVCCIRPAAVIGYNPSFRYETIVNLICIRSLYKIPINIFESALYGNKSYATVKDNANAILFAIENMDKMHGQSFNVSSFDANLKEILDIIKEEVPDINYFISPEKRINQQVYTVSSEKIKRLGFMPTGELKSTIKEAVRNLKNLRGYFYNY